MHTSTLYQRIFDKVTEPDSAERFEAFDNKTFAIATDANSECYICVDVTPSTGRLSMYVDIPSPIDPNTPITFALSDTQPFHPETVLDMYRNQPHAFARIITQAIAHNSRDIAHIAKYAGAPHMLQMLPA